MATSSSSSSSAETTEARLKRLATSIIDAHNDRDWNRVLSNPHASPAYQIIVESTAGSRAVSAKEYVQVYKSMVEQSPEHHITITNCEVTVNREHHVATVYMSMDLTGHPPGVVQSCMSVFEWRQVNDKWMLFKSVGMRGSPAASLITDSLDDRAAAAHKTTEKLLYRLSAETIQAYNDRDDNKIFAHILPNFQVTVGSMAKGQPLTREEHIEALHLGWEGSPEGYSTIMDHNVSIEPKGQAAEVHLSINLSGCPPGVIHSVNAVMFWRRIPDSPHGWLCAGSSSMRGLPITESFTPSMPPPPYKSKDQEECFESPESLLLRLSTETIDGYNTRTWSKVYAHTAPQFRITVESISGSQPQTRDEHVESYRHTCEVVFPEHHISIVDSRVALIPGQSIATVHLGMEMSGCPPGVVHSTFAVMEWRKVAQSTHGWLCVRSNAMRGAPDAVA